MSREIKPCPFCGSKHVSVMVERMSGISEYIVICKDCKISTRKEIAEEEAIKVWNKRIKDNE